MIHRSCTEKVIDESAAFPDDNARSEDQCHIPGKPGILVGGLDPGVTTNCDRYHLPGKLGN